MNDKKVLGILCVVAAVCGSIGLAQIFGTSSIISILRYPFCLWGGLQLIRATYSILVKDLELIAELFNTERACTIAFVVDIGVTILGIVWLAKFYW